MCQLLGLVFCTTSTFSNTITKCFNGSLTWSKMRPWLQNIPIIIIEIVPVGSHLKYNWDNQARVKRETQLSRRPVIGTFTRVWIQLVNTRSRSRIMLCAGSYVPVTLQQGRR